MSIKSSPLPSLIHQGLFKSKFEEFGNCSIVFKVMFKQSDEILVTYSHQEQAQEAYLSLNGTTLSTSLLYLELITDSNNTPIEKIRSPDIEITIPTNQISFLSTPSNELTPGSNHSPFFPNNTQSPVDSPRNSPGQSDYMIPESPVSVSRLPISNQWNENSLLGNELHSFDDNFKYSETNLPPLKRKCETISLVIPKKKKGKDSEMAFCMVCQRSVKKKSMKAHQNSKLHQSNLKMV